MDSKSVHSELESYKQFVKSRYNKPSKEEIKTKLGKHFLRNINIFWNKEVLSKITKIEETKNSEEEMMKIWKDKEFFQSKIK